MSGYFKSLFQLEFEENQYILEGAHPATVKKIVDFCYTGRIHLTENNVDKFLAIARLYQFDLLAQHCLQFRSSVLKTSNGTEATTIANRIGRRKQVGARAACCL